MDWITQVWGFIRPILDILILSALIYQIYKVLVQTRAIQLVKGGVIIALIYVVAYFLKLSTLLWIMNSLATVFVIIIAIVFQPELRNIFTRIGRGEWFSYGRSGKPHQLDTVLNAAEILAGRRRGGLLVFARQVVIRNVIDSGTKLNADLSSSLILTIFGHDTPLHDGAMIIKGGKILSAGCMLPLSEQVDIRRSFGTRHRAALGMAEDTDAVVLVVSEETGAISLAYDANLYYDLSMEEIRKTLKELLSLREESLEKREEALFED
ncbi:MAG: diadenylate cyclase CdaA [Spirochaetales bacterium]|nr:diadenylate cyclase CdaA [Spirochaetales bacterium]